MKSVYVRAMHALRDFLVRRGWIGSLDSWARRSRGASWLRSLLAIHDLEALVELDTPWWTYESSALVAQHLAQHPDARVFEWGSGASTVWLSHRAAHVIAVEHDGAWGELVTPYLGPRTEVRIVPPVPSATGARSRKPGFGGLDFTNYVAAIDATEAAYDLIVIDGRAREACLDRALAHLAEGGLVLFDNVDRRRYRDAIAATPDVVVTWTRGLTPALPYPTRTALLRRSIRA